MSLTRSQFALVQRIERERRSIDRAAVGAGLKYANTALKHARSAIRIGHDPVQAVKDVLVGNPGIAQPGLVPLLTREMLVAHLTGRRRSILEARHPELLSTENADERNLRKKQEKLLLLLLLTEEEVEAIRQEYSILARKLVGSLTTPLLGRVSVLWTEPLPIYLPDENRAAIPAMLKEVGTEFERAGFTIDSPYGIANTFETASVMAYDDGRKSGWSIPQIKESVGNLKWTAVLDDRTTPLCRHLDGTVRPADDLFWKALHPPAHFNCRSVLIETSDQITDIPDIEPFMKMILDFKGYGFLE